jgi:DNA-binding transcriptional ArsR family regulator
VTVARPRGRHSTDVRCLRARLPLRSAVPRSREGRGAPGPKPRAGARRAARGRGKALGEPTRLTLAAALSEGGELCVCDLAWVLERAENLVSHHLRALRAAGLVTSRRRGKMVIYALTPREGELLAVAIAQGAAA